MLFVYKYKIYQNQSIAIFFKIFSAEVEIIGTTEPSSRKTQCIFQETGNVTNTKSTGHSRLNKKNLPEVSPVYKESSEEVERTSSDLITKTKESRNQKSLDKVKHRTSIKSVTRSHCSVNENVTFEPNSPLPIGASESDNESVTELSNNVDFSASSLLTSNFRSNSESSNR